MNANRFVKGLAKTCRDAAVVDCIANFESPPGRKPSTELVELSRWWLNLRESERNFVQRAMQQAADATLFGVLCVIDGARTVEQVGPKTDFRLTAVRDGETLTIAPGDEYLHDILRTQL